MRNFSFLLSIIFCLSGCAAFDTYHMKYLNSEAWEDDTMLDAVRTFKWHYLEYDEYFDPDIKRARDIAIRSIMGTPLMNIYRADLASVDEDPGLPKSFSYIFVHFPPKEITAENVHTSYLVVVRRFNHDIIYSGEFQSPDGDSFYRYNDILSKAMN